jgi:transcriptional regulator with XRE-family HTH domain
MDSERTKALKKTLGANIRLARLRQGLTQEHAAELIGISPEVYGRLERGGIYPRVVRLLVICEKFGVSADQLLGLSAMERPLPTVEVAPRQDEWFMVIHRFMTVVPKLTQGQRLAARRHLADFHRVLLSFVDPGAKIVVKQQKRRRKSEQPEAP